MPAHQPRPPATYLINRSRDGGRSGSPGEVRVIRSPQNLAELEASLDRMVAPATLTVRESDIERIFPAEDGTLVRLERFASDHNCVPIHAFDGIVFEKVHR